MTSTSGTETDDTPLPSAGQAFVPDLNCPDCHGRGFVRQARSASECRCVLRQRYLHYLTPTYGLGIPWDPAFSPRPLEGRDVAVTNPMGLSPARFQAVAASTVKSFLLTTNARLLHRTVTPTEIFSILFQSDDRRGHADLTANIELLIIPFGADRLKNTLGEDVAWLLDRRWQNRRATWLLLPNPPSSSGFIKMYKASGIAEVLSERLDRFVQFPVQGLNRA